MSEAPTGASRKLTKNPLGPSGECVRRNVTRLREARGWDKTELARRVREMGRPMPDLGIPRIESGARRVDVDDLVALAVALDVNISALLLPPSDADGEQCGVTGAGDVNAKAAWDWADGQRPLRYGADPSAAHLQFLMSARPAGRRMTDLPAVPHDPDE